MSHPESLGGSALSTARLRQLVARHRRTVLVPDFEPLEGRVVPSTITVTNVNNDGSGSLRAAIAMANLDVAQDTIIFDPAVTGTIALLSPLPDVSTALLLSGPGSATLTVARSSDPLTSFRIFNVTAGAEVVISGLTISGDREPSGNGGGIANFGTLLVTNSTLSGNSVNDDSGGGIANFGTLLVTNSTLSGNSANSGSGNSANSGSGGGIANFGTLTVTNSTLSRNTASGISSISVGAGSGGGIANFGTLTVVNSTLSGNFAIGVITGGRGGGIANNSGTVTVTNSTLSDNLIGRLGRGGGIFNNSGTVTVTNSTLAGNDFGCIANISGVVTVASSLFANFSSESFPQGPSPSFVSRGHNLFSDAPAVTLDPTDLINTDPLLGPLADNGGPTQTMALLPGSPAINSGLAVAGVTADQRGVPRPQGTTPDIGAFESRGFTLVIDSGNNQSAAGGSTFPMPLVVRVASPFDEPVVGGRVRFAAPTAGPSASFATNPAVIDASGLASAVATANGLGGSYTVTAQAVRAVAGLAFALENLVTLIPPTVVRLQRYGVHVQPTTLVLRFSMALDPARAQDVSNYQIVTLGGHGRGGSRFGQVTRVLKAVYDPTTGSVTLQPARRLDLRNIYRLTVRGTAPTGLTSSTGVLLDGAATGQQGSNFVTTISRGTLVRSSRAFSNQIRFRWASQMRITGR